MARDPSFSGCRRQTDIRAIAERRAHSWRFVQKLIGPARHVVLFMSRHCAHPVDRQNPASVGRWFIPRRIGCHVSQVVLDFIHLHYVTSVYTFMISNIYVRPGRWFTVRAMTWLPKTRTYQSVHWNRYTSGAALFSEHGCLHKM